MITTIKVQNFKSLLNSEIALSNLNLLTGINGMGKSSLIQVLLLLRQSYNKRESLTELHLNLEKDLCELGVEKDIITRNTKDNFIHFALNTSLGIIDLTYSMDKQGEKDVIEQKNFILGTEFKEFPLFSKRFQYIGAERISPRSKHKISESMAVTKNQLSEQKGQCEYTIDFLERHRKKEIHLELLQFPDVENKELLEQVDAWMGVISPNIKIIPKRSGNTLELTIKHYGEDYKPINVGFGISYSLPIVVALLSAQAGDLIIIENPEAHLHPKGQSKLAELMCLAAQAGVQIFCETHSDHIVNGTLVNIYEHSKDKNKGISHENVNISFFRRDENVGNSKVVRILINEIGRIQNHTEDFFDQYSIDIRKLIKK